MLGFLVRAKKEQSSFKLISILSQRILLRPLQKEDFK